ncbi:MAG: ATP-binding protein [Halobacteriota archaeon]
MDVLGRRVGASGVAGRLGTYRARDGSDGGHVGIDFERPHAGVVVGKRGTGKSYTLGVLAEAAARVEGVAPVVVDPMGVFSGLADGDEDVAARVVDHPTVRADAVAPSAWPALVGLDPTEAAGSLVWRAASETATVEGMCEHVAEASTPAATRRAATNHLRVAESWGVFDSGGLTAEALLTDAVTVLDLSGYRPAATNAVVGAVARAVYESRIGESTDRLPWLLVDEAHAACAGVAEDAIRTLYTRGRAPGVSAVLATQRPSALPSVAVSQSDLLVAHRLTAVGDIEALAAATPTYLRGAIDARLPTERGCALVVDDATESAHLVRIRRRVTPHGGGEPRVSERW